MGLKAVYEKAEDVPENLRDAYVLDEASKKMVLDVENVDALPKVRGLVTAKTAAQQARDALKTENEQLKDRIKDIPEDFDRSEWDTRKETKPDALVEAAKQQAARALAAAQAKHASELAERDNQIKQLDGSIDRSVAEDALTRSLRKAGIKPALEEGARAMLIGKIKVDRDDKGNRTPIVDTDFGPTQVESYVTEWAKGPGKDYLGTPSGPAPRNGNPGTAGQKVMKRSDFEALDPGSKNTVMMAGTQLTD